MSQNNTDNNSTKSGVVSMYNPNKGFGFIKQDSGAKDVFFHISDVQDIASESIEQGLKIQYKLKSEAGKERAVGVTAV